MPALVSLVDSIGSFDFAVFVFTPDDVLELRGERKAAVRDNVIFELGLFLGGLGLGNCFFVTPKDCPDLHLPSDLLGILPLAYRADRSDGNLLAALGPACNQIRRAIRESRQARQTVSPRTTRPLYSQLALSDYVNLWNSPDLMDARTVVRSFPWDFTHPEFGGAKDELRRIFVFLEGFSDAVLSGALDEAEAERAFGDAVRSVWPVWAQISVPPSAALDDAWDELPRLGELFKRWSR